MYNSPYQQQTFNGPAMPNFNKGGNLNGPVKPGQQQQGGSPYASNSFYNSMIGQQPQPVNNQQAQQSNYAGGPGRPFHGGANSGHANPFGTAPAAPFNPAGGLTQDETNVPQGGAAPTLTADQSNGVAQQPGMGTPANAPAAPQPAAPQAPAPTMPVWSGYGGLNRPQGMLPDSLAAAQRRLQHRNQLAGMPKPATPVNQPPQNEPYLPYEPPTYF